MEFKFPKTETKIHITQTSPEGWGEYVVYIATPFRTLIALTEDSPEDLKDIYQVAQLLGNPQAQVTPNGIQVGTQHIVIPYEGAGLISHMRLHSYDYAFRLVDMENMNTREGQPSWAHRMLSQYAAPMDQSGLIKAPLGFDPTKPNGGVALK